MTDFTLLEISQILSDKKLEIITKRGSIAPITDFSILLGGSVSEDYYYNNSVSLENRAGDYWTQSSSEKFIDSAYNEYIVPSGLRGVTISCRRNIGSRPAVSYSSIKSDSSNKIIAEDEVIEVEYGEYPQKAAPRELQNKLTKSYKNSLSSLKKTGKKFTVDSRKSCEYHDNRKKFKSRFIDEYSFDDEKKYVRVKANSYYDGSEFILSNGEKYQNGDYVWVEVQPVKWLIDEKNDIALSEKILFAGIQFNYGINQDGDFQTTDIKKFMDRYFSKDLIQINSVKQNDFIINSLQIDVKCEEKVEKQNNFIIDSLQIDAKYEERLEKQSELIINEISTLMDNKSNLSKIEEEIKELINDSLHKRSRILFYKRKNKKENKIYLLNKLKNYFDAKETSLNISIEKYQNIKKLMVTYLKDANEYLNVLNETKKHFDDEIINKEYNELDFNIYDDSFKQNFLQNKIITITNAITQMLNQYQKIILKMNTSISILNHIELAKNTLIQINIDTSLYDNSSEEIDNINLLGEVTKLFNNITNNNINNKVVNNIELSEESKILLSEALIESDIQEQEETDVKIKKKV